MIKEFNPDEKSFEIYENVLFTKILVQDLRKMSLIDLALPLMLIAQSNDLELFFSDAGILCANMKHYKKACSILEESVLYN
jgi:regulator of sirC expression with transglutaminase-like and TPR domain